MTIPEYELRVKAARLKEVDTQERIHMLAWAIKQASATKKNGRSVYKNFKQFFNKKKIIDEMENTTTPSEDESLSASIKRAYRKLNRKDGE